MDDQIKELFQLNKDFRKCTKCGYEGLKYYFSYIINDDLRPDQFNDAENNPDKVFDEILCANCAPD